MTPTDRAGLLADLGAHLDAHALAPSDPPTPAGCVVLLALTVDCAALAIGGSWQAGGVVCRAPEVDSRAE